MSVRFAAVDRHWKQTSEMPVDLRVCECCPTTAAVTSEGPIVAYRNRTEDEVRDIFVSRLENGKWTEPQAVHADGWKIAACPVNGPMLSARGQPRTFTVAGLAGGRSSGYPRIAAQANELVFAWTETGGAAPRVLTASARLPTSSARPRTGLQSAPVGPADDVPAAAGPVSQPSRP